MIDRAILSINIQKTLSTVFLKSRYAIVLSELISLPGKKKGRLATIYYVRNFLGASRKFGDTVLMPSDFLFFF